MLPVIILKRVVVASSLEPTNAILSSWFTINDTLSSTLTPSIVLEIPSTVSTSLPISLAGLKSIYGYFLLDGLISSNSIFSRALFLEVACLDLEALAENLWIKSCNSLIFSSLLLISFLHLLDNELT